jgi:hypothetical protein
MVIISYNVHADTDDYCPSLATDSIMSGKYCIRSQTTIYLIFIHGTMQFDRTLFHEVRAARELNLLFEKKCRTLIEASSGIPESGSEERWLNGQSCV